MARNCNTTSNYLSSGAASFGSSSVPPATVNGNTGTVSIWVKPSWNSGDSVWHQFFEFTTNAANSNRIEALKFSDNNFYVGTFAGIDNRVIFADTGLVSSGVYFNLIFSYTIASLGTAYFNGVSKGTSSPVALGTAIDTCYVGIDHSITGSAAAAVADIAVWNVVLTQAEITAIVKGARPSTIRPLSLIWWPPLDGLVSPEPDLSGKANNLPLVGSPAISGGPPVMQFTPRWPQFNFPPPAPFTIMPQIVM